MRRTCNPHRFDRSHGLVGKAGGRDKAAEDFLKNMVKDGLGQPKRMNENFDQVACWAKKNGVRVIVNEFGVYVPFAPAADRYRWMADVRKAAESHGFGWAHWDYCTGMPVVTGQPGAHHWDPQAAAALGLKAGATSN